MFKLLSTAADTESESKKSWLDEIFDFFSKLLSGIGYAIESIFSIFS